MTGLKEIAREFVTSYFNIRNDFFDTAWDFVNANFDRISSVATSTKDMKAIGGPLAFGGREEQGAVKAILIFADGFREMPLKSDFSGLVDSVREACSKYKAETRLTEEILKKVTSLENRIAKFMKPEETKGGKKTEINFTETEVQASDGESLSKDNPLILSEYIILKERVHWLWSFVTLPIFETKKPKWQFRNYISKKRVILRKYGLKITALKKAEDDYAKFEGIEDAVESNIQDVKKHYNKAISLFNEDKLKNGIEELTKITTSYYKWYSFSDAYMKLTEWIRMVNFEGISEKLITDCRDFLSWYSKRLQVGISRIEFYRKQLLSNKNKLDKIAEQEFQKIKEELGKVEDNLQALIHKIPLSKEDEEYEVFVNFLIDAQEKLMFIQEQEAETEETRQEACIQVLIELQKENKYFDNIVKDAFKIMGNELYRLDKSKTYSDELLREESREIYWFIRDLIIELKNFDEFELKKGNRLGMLTSYFNNGLENKIKKWLSGRI